jgi:hypothetical protein
MGEGRLLAEWLMTAANRLLLKNHYAQNPSMSEIAWLQHLRLP